MVLVSSPMWRRVSESTGAKSTPTSAPTWSRRSATEAEQPRRRWPYRTLRTALRLVRKFPITERVVGPSRRQDGLGQLRRSGHPSTIPPPDERQGDASTITHVLSVRIGHVCHRYSTAEAAGTRTEKMRPRSSLFGSSAAWDEAADPCLSGSRLQGGPHRTGSAQSAPAGVRIESDSSLEVEPPVLIQIEFAIE